MAGLCAATHLQPSEYKDLTLRQRNAFIRVAERQAKAT